MRFLSGFAILAVLMPFSVSAETVGVANDPIYVTKADCQAMVAHHPSADVTYQPGQDVHGRAVAPADLPGSGASSYQPPDKLSFDIAINPMMYAGVGKTTTAAGQNRFANTSQSVAHVDIDLKNNQTSLNGQSLGSMQQDIVLQACRKAGFR